MYVELYLKLHIHTELEHINFKIQQLQSDDVGPYSTQSWNENCRPDLLHKSQSLFLFATFDKLWWKSYLRRNEKEREYILTGVFYLLDYLQFQALFRLLQVMFTQS